MKIIIIPPYKGMNYTPEKGQFMLQELVDTMEAKGQLNGVKVDIDEGHTSEYSGQNRDQAVYVDVTAGLLKRMRMHCQGDTYDAIVASAGNDHCFYAARLISKIPVAFTVHSAVHFASLIGDRCSIVHTVDPSNLMMRQYVENYGLGHKLISVRYIGHTTTQIANVIREYNKEERSKVPEGKKLIDDTVAQCVTAVEEDRSDSIALPFPGLQCIEDDIRRALDDAGYEEIPLICGLSTAMETAKAMVSMRLKQAPRAYPADALKAKPKFR